MTYKFGVIGVGTWGEQHLKTISTHPHCELAMICDLNEDLVKQRAREYGAKAWTTDYQEVLADPDIAAVSVVTPDHVHREITVATAQAGKHMLIEKPLATTVEDCEAILSAARKNDVKIMVDFHNRFNTPFVNAKRAIEDGEIGQPQMMSVRLNDTVFVPTEMLSWGGKSTVAWFLASHAVDLIRWLFEDEVVRVYSVSRSRVLEKMGITTPDFFHSILELQNGGVAHVENCWIMSPSMPTVFDFKLELIGEEGTLFADLSGHRMLQKYTANEAVYPDCIGSPLVHGRYV
ncbi:MAG: Gfo/Idh/MocA family protein, partial [Armatimonadota bacterium]